MSPRISAARGKRIRARLSAMTGASDRVAKAEVEASIRRAFFYAAHADKFDGARSCDAVALRDHGDERALGRHGHRLPGRGAAACLRLARHAGDRDGQLRRRGPVGPPSACARPTSIRCSTRRMCPAASSTSSPAKRTRWPGPSPSTTASTRSGMSGDAEGAAEVEALPPAISRRPGARPERRLGEGRGPRVPAPRVPDQEHLDALRRIAPR